MILIGNEEDSRFMQKNKVDSTFKNEMIIISEASDVKPGIDRCHEQNTNPTQYSSTYKWVTAAGSNLLYQIPNKDFEVVFVTSYSQLCNISTSRVPIRKNV